MFSDPRELGTYTANEDGTIRVEILEDVEFGEHQLAACDEAGDVIGWQAVAVVAPGGIGAIGAPGSACPAWAPRWPTRERRPRCG